MTPPYLLYKDKCGYSSDRYDLWQIAIRPQNIFICVSVKLE